MPMRTSCKKQSKKAGFNANATCSIDVQEEQNAQSCQENAFVIRELEDAKMRVGVIDACDVEFG